MGALWVIIFFILVFLSYAFYSSSRNKNYFSSRKVFHLNNTLFSLFHNMVIKRIGVFGVVRLNYEKMKQANVTIAGNMVANQVDYMITDLDLLKHICVKDFDHFVHRRIKVPDSDPLVQKMMVFLNCSDSWKTLRTKMSPTFTSGKIKQMFAAFDASSSKLVNYIDNRLIEATNPSGEIDLWESYSKFAMDTIASTVFGMDSQAFNQVEPSIFERMGNKLKIEFNPGQFLILMGFPKIAKALGMSMFGSDMHSFFSGAIKSSIQARKKSGERRHDFIQLMMDARENVLKLNYQELNRFERDAQLEHFNSVSNNSTELLDDDGIVSNCVLFLLAGFETIRALLLFSAYVLALYPDVQEKLREEVEACLEKNDGLFTYESLHEMTYLDQVVNETLRFYSPVPFSDRLCVKDYRVPGTDIVIQKGNGVIIPIVGIHHDERYYPQPEKFIPERFSAENKRKIPSYAFFAFGQGPRNCIGTRFALTEVKLAIAHIVDNFDIGRCKKTLVPMQFGFSLSVQPKDGMWVALKRRPKTKC